MNTFAIEKWFDEGKLCSFYTVRWEDNNESETDRFFNNHEGKKKRYNTEAYELIRLITHSIADIYGATDVFFDRHKNKAQALPPKPKYRIPEIQEIGIHFPLRLYCFRISESIVVLFNGGVKDHATDQESKDLSFKFIEAQQFAKRIAEALQNGTIVADNSKRTLVDFQGNHEIFI